MEKEMRRTGKFDKDGREMMAGDIVHFRCKNFSLSWRGIVFLAEKEDSLGEDSFRIRDTRPGKNNGRIYPYYPDAKYRIDVHIGEEVDREKEN